MSGLPFTQLLINHWRVRCQQLIEEIKNIENRDAFDGRLPGLRVELKQLQGQLVIAALEDAP